MKAGTILHVNAVGLMASLEENFDHSLVGRPFVIASPSALRACVLDVSHVAHGEGLRPGMNLARARELVPDIIIMPPRHRLYEDVDKQMRQAALSYTPLVESAGGGHLFIDLAGTSRLHGAPEDAACRLKSEITRQTCLRPVIALAGGKTASKVATRVFRPEGFVALSSRDESLLLARQPVTLLPGIGPGLHTRLKLLSIMTIGALGSLSPAEAKAIGPRGPFLAARARGSEDSPVDPSPPGSRVLTTSHVFEPDSIDPREIVLKMTELIADLGFSMRTQHAGAHRVHVVIIYTDGIRSSATVRSPYARTRDNELVILASQCLDRAFSRRVRIRELEISCAELEASGPELDLFEPASINSTDSLDHYAGPAICAPLESVFQECRMTFDPACHVPPHMYNTKAERPEKPRSLGTVPLPSSLLPPHRAERLQQALDTIRQRHGPGYLLSGGVFALHHDKNEIQYSGRTGA